MNPRIRKATPADLDVLTALSASSDPHPWRAALLAESLARHACFALEYPDGSSEGLLGLAIFQPVLDEAELLYVVVHRDHGHRGIGYSFLQSLLSELSRQGICRCFLEVRAGNSIAQGLYQKLGFIPTGCRKGYYPGPVGSSGREDALTLLLNLGP